MYIYLLSVWSDIRIWGFLSIFSHTKCDPQLKTQPNSSYILKNTFKKILMSFKLVQYFLIICFSFDVLNKYTCSLIISLNIEKRTFFIASIFPAIRSPTSFRQWVNRSGRTRTKTFTSWVPITRLGFGQNGEFRVVFYWDKNKKINNIHSTSIKHQFSLYTCNLKIK